MSLRSIVSIVMALADKLKCSKESLAQLVLVDHVLYVGCRYCGWRANIQGVVTAPKCPECRHGLTILGGTISDVARRLEQYPDST